jgi:hypothetical protein
MPQKPPRIVTGGVSRFRAGDAASHPANGPVSQPRDLVIEDPWGETVVVPDLMVDDIPLRGVLGFYPNRERSDTAEEIAERLSPDEQAAIEHVAKAITRNRRAMNKPKPKPRRK